MSYRYVYPNGAPAVGATPVAGYSVDPGLMSTGYSNNVPANVYDNYRQQSYSPGSFSSDSESADDYEYRGRMITRDTRCPRDIVRAPTPPPIIKRVVERAPTPEAPIMERVIIRPQAQEIVERVIEQPRTPPPRIIQKEMQEEAPPPIVRTRVIKVDRPSRSTYSQAGCSNPYRTRSILGSVGRPAMYNEGGDNNVSYSSGSSFEYVPPTPMTPSVVPQTTMMMMPQGQPIGVMQQQHQPQTMQPFGVMQQQPQNLQPFGVMQQQPVQQFMYRPVQMQSPMTPQPIPGLGSNYVSQNMTYPASQGMSFGYRPMMQQQGRMIPSGMPMMAAGNNFVPQASQFQSQTPMFNPIPQQLVF